MSRRAIVAAGTAAASALLGDRRRSPLCSTEAQAAAAASNRTPGRRGSPRSTARERRIHLEVSEVQVAHEVLVQNANYPRAREG